MRYMAQKGEIVVKKLDFRGEKRVIGLEKFQTSNQTRKAKWCKMRVLFLKMDKLRDVRR